MRLFRQEDSRNRRSKKGLDKINRINGTKLRKPFHAMILSSMILPKLPPSSPVNPANPVLLSKFLSKVP